MTDYSALEKHIGVIFKDKELLHQALTHRSYLNENRDVSWGHNERLEFLGDAVLELVITEYLYKTYPNSNEGEMTALRSALVKAETLASVGGDMMVGEYLLLSRGESKDLGRARQYILANAVEAVLGAVFLDQGFKPTEKIVEKYLVPKIETIMKEGLTTDAKSKFQTQSQEHLGITPSYKTIKEAGPDHDKRFTVGDYLKDELVAEGEGDSKQVAEQNAARLALIEKNWE